MIVAASFCFSFPEKGLANKREREREMEHANTKKGIRNYYVCHRKMRWSSSVLGTSVEVFHASQDTKRSASPSCIDV
jgi:hypothetical protein